MAILENSERTHTNINNNLMEVIPELNIDLIKDFVRDTEEDILHNPQQLQTRDYDKVLFYYTDVNKNIIYVCNRKLIKENINKYKHKRHWGCLTMFCNTNLKFKMPVCTNKAHVNLMFKAGYDNGEPVNYNIL